ncbi:melatonin-related receptor-like [Nematostella vectensis]|uniref:melatonin-related receptor-like n=1 Tax=Nematostella vectensis TaxID=45351 RepID=UPI0020774567|nr:melatonin-related receptor-like [Nematostella vectensis]
MLMASIGMPLSLVTVIAGKWVFGDALCQYQGFIGTFLGTVSLLTIMLTAINRYCKITWTASRYASTFTRASTLRRISLVWGLAFLPPIIYLLTGHRYVYHPGKAMCFFDLNNASTLYAVSTITLVVFLPFCTITFCYYKVYKSVRNHNKVAVQDAREETPGPFGISEIKLTKMLFAILLGFLVCWSPFVAIDVINSINGQFSQDRWVYLVYTGCAGLASCVNPLIYSVMNAGFREEFKAMLAFRIRRDNGVNPTRPRSEANKITS